MQGEDNIIRREENITNIIGEENITKIMYDQGLETHLVGIKNTNNVERGSRSKSITKRE